MIFILFLYVSYLFLLILSRINFEIRLRIYLNLFMFLIDSVLSKKSDILFKHALLIFTLVRTVKLPEIV